MGLLRLAITFTSEIHYGVAPVRWRYPEEVAARAAIDIVNRFESPSWFGPVPRARLREAVGGRQIWDVFVLPTESRQEVELSLSTVLGSATRECANALSSIEVLNFIPPAFTPKDNPLVTALTEGAIVATGRMPHTSPLAAVTGMSPIQERLGIPIAAFGYGRLDLAHTASERIAVDDLIASSVAYAEALARLS